MSTGLVSTPCSSSDGRQCHTIISMGIAHSPRLIVARRRAQKIHIRGFVKLLDELSY